MKTVLTNYEIFPKVIPSHKEAEITIRPLGDHARFHDDCAYSLTVNPMNESNMNEKNRPYPVYELKPVNGGLVFRHAFGKEGQYVVSIKPQGEPVREVRSLPSELRVYAADEDLFRLRPWRGDMHVHSFRSDGKEAPAVVAANYRKGGFDYLALTDHGRFEPSREMIAAYKGLPIDIKLFTGEEVHPPENHTHYIHFGGEWSVNSLFEKDPDKYREEVRRIAGELDTPEGINREEFASCTWVCGKIHEAGGMAVMVHPHWIHGEEGPAYHTREDMARYMLKSGLFDAFELIGGMRLAENQAQISLWQETRAEGCFMPIVGSSDSHGTVNAEWFQSAKTVVLSETCEKDAVFDAIRKGRGVALEQYHGETAPRIYGLYRYVMFTRFLVEEYFPLHDELCYEEGRLMRDYVCGDKEAGELLKRLQGRCAKLMNKCWGTGQGA
jgi:predicted metal-dependent phosphoesterase TrpH